LQPVQRSSAIIVPGVGMAARIPPRTRREDLKQTDDMIKFPILLDKTALSQPMYSYADAVVLLRSIGRLPGISREISAHSQAN
jgi:hypothetical protein